MRLRLREIWEGNIGIALLLGLFALAIALLYQARTERLTASDYESVDARISSFSTTDNDSAFPPRVRVTAITADGAIGEARVAPERILGCQIGDKIEAQQRGLDVKLSPEPCIRSD